MDKTIHVKGMSCGHCVAAVEGSVSKLEGVSSVAVLLEKGEVNVTFDEGKVELSAIEETIEDQGFDVV